MIAPHPSQVAGVAVEPFGPPSNNGRLDARSAMIPGGAVDGLARLTQALMEAPRARRAEEERQRSANERDLLTQNRDAEASRHNQAMERIYRGRGGLKQRQIDPYKKVVHTDPNTNKTLSVEMVLKTPEEIAAEKKVRSLLMGKDANGDGEEDGPNPFPKEDGDSDEPDVPAALSKALPAPAETPAGGPAQAFQANQNPQANAFMGMGGLMPQPTQRQITPPALNDALGGPAAPPPTTVGPTPAPVHAGRRVGKDEFAAYLEKQSAKQGRPVAPQEAAEHLRGQGFQVDGF